MSVSERQPQRVASLDGVRGLAILAVVLHHYFHAKLLWMGVDLFFILSGFLITGILLRQRDRTFGRYIGHFYKRRGQRILVPYVLTLVLAGLLYGTWWLHWWPYYLGAMNFIYTTGVRSPLALPFWSLAVEEQFYLLWPVVIFWLPRKQLLGITTALLLLAPVLRYLCQPLFVSPFSIYMLLPFRMDTLATGALLALIWPEFRDAPAKRTSVRRTLRFAIPVCFAAAIALLGFFGHEGVTTFHSTPLSSALIYEASLLITASIFCAALFGMLPRMFTFRPLLWLGTLSYTIYLVHLIMLDVFRLKLPPLLATLPALACTILYALASWTLIEKPLLHLGKGDSSAVLALIETETSTRKLARHS